MKGRQMIIIVDDDKPGELLKCLFLESIKIRNYFDGINAFLGNKWGLTDKSETCLAFSMRLWGFFLMRCIRNNR